MLGLSQVSKLKQMTWAMSRHPADHMKLENAIDALVRSSGVAATPSEAASSLALCLPDFLLEIPLGCPLTQTHTPAEVCHHCVQMYS